ncbi:hypothetical protein FRX31_021839 [Thalictrum thalictroides]|uniref:DUF4283 domain-containing protein n=1 Tax=Thalictrum thalictroides TaxID=46969 RepID=A0A7J6VU14_THATH|nr:hypothetical protein FRX31_021839 [Thalictrum thalictroides]
MVGSQRVICFPQGRNGVHWCAAGNAMGRLFRRNLAEKHGFPPLIRCLQSKDVVPSHDHKVLPDVGSVCEAPVIIISSWPKPYMSWNSKTEMVEVLSKGQAFGAVSWLSAVLCKGNLPSDSWELVFEKTRGKFQMKDLQILSDQSAILFLYSEEDASRLSFTPSFSLGNVIFSFEMWNPTMGSLVRSEEKEWWVSLVGFPLHLKHIDCITSLATVLGF